MSNKKSPKATNDRKQMASFLSEEFRQNWAYIRHLEETRLRHTHIFLIITGAIISAFSFLIRPVGTNSLQQPFQDLFNLIITRYKLPILTGSFFIFLYGFLLCVFLAHQKRGYEHYRIVNAEIRHWFIEKYGKENQFYLKPPVSFEKKRLRERTTRQLITSTFFYWYLLVVLINCFAFMVFIVTVAPSWWLIWKVILIIGIFCLESWIFIRLGRKVKKIESI